MHRFFFKNLRLFSRQRYPVSKCWIRLMQELYLQGSQKKPHKPRNGMRCSSGKVRLRRKRT